MWNVLFRVYVPYLSVKFLNVIFALHFVTSTPCHHLNRSYIHTVPTINTATKIDELETLFTKIIFFFIHCLGPGTYPKVGTNLHSQRRLSTYRVNWTIHRQTNSQSVKSRTGHLADWIQYNTIQLNVLVLSLQNMADCALRVNIWDNSYEEKAQLNRCDLSARLKAG